MNNQTQKTSITITQQDFLSLNPSVDDVRNAPRIKDCIGSYGFCYYTKLDTFKLILKSKKVWVRNVTCMNDKKEFIDPTLDKTKFHLLCFSNSDDEIIPMWYMYAGTSGNGIRIRLTPGVLRLLLKDIKIYRPDQTILNNYNISCGWIYYKYGDDYYEHRNKKYEIDDWDPSFNKSNLFIKSKHWNYEKEFRIVIENLDDVSYDHLELDLTNVFDRLQFMRGPEFDDNKLSPKEKSFLNQVKYSDSQLYIKMNL